MLGLVSHVPEKVVVHLARVAPFTVWFSDSFDLTNASK
jgi:hypothetical protein